LFQASKQQQPFCFSFNKYIYLGSILFFIFILLLLLRLFIEIGLYSSNQPVILIYTINYCNFFLELIKKTEKKMNALNIKCFKCTRTFDRGEQMSLYKNNYYHNTCFVCSFCEISLAGCGFFTKPDASFVIIFFEFYF
jgi:hypothetical protein